MNNRIKKKNGAMAISRVTDRRTGPTLCLERELMTKTSKTFAVMQGLRPLFSLRFSGLHHSKENRINRLVHYKKNLKSRGREKPYRYFGSTIINYYFCN